MAKPKAIVSRRLAKLPKWNAWCSCELESATLTPNQLIRMIAKPREEIAAHGHEHVAMTGQQIRYRLDDDDEILVGSYR